VHLDQETAAAEVQAIVYRSPRLYELQRSRWSYQGLRQVCPWLHPLTDAGICQVLKRLRVRSKRGHLSVHSPDLQ
jgi:transposase